MAARFALSWNRSAYWASKLRKPPGRAVSSYQFDDYDVVEGWAQHINEQEPRMQCAVEVFTS